MPDTAIATTPFGLIEALEPKLLQAAKTWSHIDGARTRRRLNFQRNLAVLEVLDASKNVTCAVHLQSVQGEDTSSAPTFSVSYTKLEGEAPSTTQPVLMAAPLESALEKASGLLLKQFATYVGAEAASPAPAEATKPAAETEPAATTQTKPSPTRAPIATGTRPPIATGTKAPIATGTRPPVKTDTADTPDGLPKGLTRPPSAAAAAAIARARSRTRPPMATGEAPSKTSRPPVNPEKTTDEAKSAEETSE